jgi:hypothetical protein
MSFFSGAWKAVTTVSGGLAKKVWGSFGLYLGYIAIGITIALGCAAVWFYHQNTTLHESVGALNKTVEQRGAVIEDLKHNNSQQDKAINELTELRKTDKAVVNGLLSDYRRISATTTDTKAKIRELEKRNAEVRSYLNTPLPDSVRRVLNGQPEAGSAVPNRNKD